MMYFDWKCSALRQWLTIDYKKIPDDVAYSEIRFHRSWE